MSPKKKMLTFLLFLLSFTLSSSENFQFILKEPITNFTAMKEKDLIGDAWPYIKMIDASTKIPTGLAVLSLYDLGNFDECYNIVETNFTGKYCLGTINLPGSGQTFQKNIMQVHPTPRELQPLTGYTFATCAPSYLSAEEINQFTLTTINEAFCYSKDTEPELSTAAIVTIVILAVIIEIAVVQTIYDIYLYYTKQKTKHELLIAFSFLTNGKKLFTTSTNPDQLLCLNGIRALSMMWVVIGHEFSGVTYVAIKNFMETYTWMADVGNMYIMGATVSVDTFFLAGGMVTVYTFLKAQDKGVKFNIILYYIHRYLRLTPALAVIVLIHRNLIPYIEKAPMWGYINFILVEGCVNDWWKVILYISNFFKVNQCIGQSWYLNVDMQLFVLSPLILLPLVKWRKYTIYTLYMLIVAGCIVPFAIAYGKNIGTMINDPDFNTEYYMQTYTRFGPYVIGMLFGYYIYDLRKNKKALNIPKIWVFACWLLSLGVMVACVYDGHEFFSYTGKPTTTSNAFYLGLNRQVWSAAVGVVIFLCVSGNGGPINSFLSLYIFQFITKISYSIYLIHVTVIMVRTGLLKSPIMFSPWAWFHYFWGDFMFTLILAIPFCLLFESPIIILEKYIFGKR